jgi:phospholipid/cholesterol/gamma-HCH transport system ATP-binding protein
MDLHSDDDQRFRRTAQSGASRARGGVSAAAAPLVEIRDLHFSYGSNRIFRGLDLSVPRGKMVAILGASGCGKSTLLRLIGGQARPDRGSVTVEGQVVHELDNDALYAMRRRMGMMFQVSGLFSDISVFENIAFPMREHYDLPEDLVHTLVLMKLHAVGLRGAHALMPGDLSGGMSRRVALARAIAIDPMIAMYDEPFAGLDPISLNVIAQLIRRSTDALGSTSIVVTYDVSEALEQVDYIYVIAEGVVAGHGTPAELLASDDPFLKQFLHALPDGPVRFHFPGRTLAEDVGLARTVA